MADQNNAPESLKDLIYRVLRDYRQTEVADEYGHGYPLVDALTITGQGIDMGEREIANIAEMLAYEIARADRTAPTDNTALVEALKDPPVVKHAIGRDTPDEDAWRELMVKAAAALASHEAPPVAQEPLAWRYRNAAGDCKVWTNPETRRRSAYGRIGMEEQPLYAAPPPACQQEAMPVGCGQPCGYDCNGACFDPPACQQEAVAKLIGDARLALDTGAILFGETADYRPEDIQAILDILDAALRALKGEA